MRGEKVFGIKVFLLIFSIFFILIISVGSVSAAVDCSIEPDGTYCGDCIVSSCWINGNPIDLDYLISGTKTCQDDVCSDLTCIYDRVCSDPDIFDGVPNLIGISVSGCAASCDQDEDCSQYEYDPLNRLCQYDGGCSETSCICEYGTEETCPEDGWFCVENSREYREYSCTENGCNYIVTNNEDCDNNNVCDGLETCSAGACVSGTPLTCDDGLWCNGIETCDSLDGCLSGQAPDCGDDIGCTIDSCDEETDSCDNIPNDDICDNELFCDGAETCDIYDGCQAGTPPIVDDGVGCTNDFCDEESDTIINDPNNANCDDGAYCNGEETCDAELDCQSGTSVDCDDEISCTVDSCNEDTDSCDNSPDNTLCNDGAYCNGEEVCEPGQGCVDGTSIDCSINDILSIGTCLYSPDDNSFTWDYFAGFTSTCDEISDSCTTGTLSLTHTCDVGQCEAECDSTHTCDNKCEGDIFYFGGVCDLLGNCGCSWDYSEDCNLYDCENPETWECRGVGSSILAEYGDDYTCLPGEGEVDCGITYPKIVCDGEWVCDVEGQCGTQECGGDDYICHNSMWVSEVQMSEDCTNQIDDDCDGLIDCEDPDCGDDTPPQTFKEYAEWPFVDEQGIHYINNLTLISLFAEDLPGQESECVSGLDTIMYRYCLDPGCYGDEIPCSCPETPWIEYDGEEPFTEFIIPEDSEHCIEFKSNDSLGNEEEIESQCVFVDNIGPVPNKTVEEVKTKWLPNLYDNDTEVSYFYPEETAHCWDGTEEEIECWKVTLETPINMECYDPAPHPVGFEQLCFKVNWDGEDVTENYCRYEGSWWSKEGYCCVDYNITEFYFHEESEHNLEYYCEDKLGNRQYDDEKFKVFGWMEEIDLEKKWNLISVPVDPINKTPEAVFSEVEGNIDSIWSYDAEMDDWDVYRPGSSLNDLEKIETGLGYWVMALNSDELVVGGSLLAPGPIVPASRKVIKGWNLIGHYGTETPRDVYCSLFSLIDTQQGFPRWSALWGYDTSSQTFVPLSSSGETQVGEGYWLEMDVDDLYAPSTECYGYT